MLTSGYLYWVPHTYVQESAVIFNATINSASVQFVKVPAKQMCPFIMSTLKD